MKKRYIYIHMAEHEQIQYLHSTEDKNEEKKKSH